MRKLPLTWPDPSHPGVGHDMPSVLTDFQENWEPLRYPSFCRLAANGQPDALRCEAYFPVMWPWPSHPGTGHLGGRKRDTLCHLASMGLAALNRFLTPDVEEAAMRSCSRKGGARGRRHLAEPWNGPPREVLAEGSSLRGNDGTHEKARCAVVGLSGRPCLGRTPALMG